MNPTPPGFAELTWTRFEVALRNVRNLESKSNPLVVLPAILKFACHEGFPSGQFYGLTPLHALPQRVALNGVYSFRVNLPGRVVDEALLLQKGLRAHLEGAGRNYTLERLSPPELRTGADVLAASAELEKAEPEEICLDFHTPLPLTGLPSADGRGLGPEVLRALALARLRKFFGPSTPEPPALEGCVTLPYFLRTVRSRHRSKSNGEEVRQDGLAGPLYLRGALQPWLPWLNLLAEIQLSGRKGDAMGVFALRLHRPALEAALLNPSTYLDSARQWSERSDTGDELVNALVEPESVCADIAQAIRSGSYQTQPLRAHRIAKPDGGWRTIGVPAPRDRIAQESLLDLLGTPCERMFEEASIGYRAGKSVRTARTAILNALREGYEWAFESDIESFFDQLDWDGLDRALAARFPRAEATLLAALRVFARAPLADAEGRILERHRGIPQGSPLSPLLANLYLDTFDEEMGKAGHRLIRYGDDFLVLARTREEAEKAGTDAARLLGELQLRLKPEKTAIRSLGDRFRFLGMEIGPELDEEAVEQAGLKSPLFVRQLYAMAGVDGDSVVVSRKGETLLRVPAHRLSEIVVMGGNVVSTRLVQRCADMRIPLSFCTAAGWHVNSLIPPSRAAHETAGRHQARYAALSEEERVSLARQLVRAKVTNHREWLVARRAPASARQELENTLHHLGGQASVEALRGAEGYAARVVYRAVNDMVEVAEFRSESRQPRTKPDRWNALLDAVYSLLFARLNVLLRSRGLNPYLGFLHSADSPYESLVCDLQEPFRARMDRLAVKLVNRRMITSEDFEVQTWESWRLTLEGFGKVMQSFEEELGVESAGEAAPLHQILLAQVLGIKAWVEQNREPAFYCAPVRRAFQ